MKTRILMGSKEADIIAAGEILREGGLVAIPTETVYGLAGNALDGSVVKRIYEAKGRPSDNPLIVHICDVSQLAPLVETVPEAAKKLADAFWPGPLTMIMKKSSLIPKETSGGLDTVAVRLPSHPVAQSVIRAAGVPLAAPSANLSGKPSPTMFCHVQEDLTGRVDALLDGGDCAVGVESTVITLTGPVPRVLRPGGITVSQLREVLGEVEVDDAVVHRLQDGAQAASPGMKYKHYSPKADVVMVDASPADYAAFVNSQPDCCALCFDEDVSFIKGTSVSYGSRYDDARQAHMLFYALHYLDEIGAKKVYARMPSRKGVGLAVYNRLIRSAGFQILRLHPYKLIGLTGPTGAGKSSVAARFQELGCGVVDCDALTKSSSVYDNECLQKLAEAFGEDVVEQGVLRRDLVAQRAFSSPEGKEKLQAITFPKIMDAVKQAVAQEVAAGKQWILLDAPTLFESGLDRYCSRIVVVSAEKQIRLQRIMERDGLTQEQAIRRMAAQKDADYYEKRADNVLENSFELPQRHVEEIVKEWMEEM